MTKRALTAREIREEIDRLRQEMQRSNRPRRSTTRSSRVVKTTEYKPIVTFKRSAEWDDQNAALREYRRELRLCETDSCACLCQCHSGIACPIIEGTARIHTRKHRTERHIVRDPISNVASEVFVDCHDPDPDMLKPTHFRV
jgi:hypothetical protein